MGLYREDFGGGGSMRLGIAKAEERFCKEEHEDAGSREQQSVRACSAP